MRVRLLPVVAVALAAALASPAFAYRIYLKDGSQVEAREKPTVQGKFVVFYTPLGAMQRIPVAEFDQKKSDEMNALGTGNAYVLGDTPGEKPIPSANKPSLSQYIQVNRKSEIGTEKKPVEVARESKAAKIADPAAGAAGTVDPQLETAFLRTLETYGVKAPRVVAAGNGIRVQGIAETEEQVFAAIKGIARAVSDSKGTSHPVPKADIYLTTSSGESAGHYEMLPDDAEALASGRRTPVSWFMANVSL